MNKKLLELLLLAYGNNQQGIYMLGKAQDALLAGVPAKEVVEHMRKSIDAQIMSLQVLKYDIDTAVKDAV